MTRLDELKAQMSEAVKVFQATGDMSKIQEASKAMDKAKSEIAKAEAESLRKEAEALAGKREALALSIHQTVKQLGLDKSITGVKGWGFTYKIDNAVPNEPETNYKSVALLTQTVKARTAGGAGARGKSKDEYGISLQGIFDKYATDEDRTSLASAETNSKQWQVKVAVKKKALADGLLKPVK